MSCHWPGRFVKFFVQYCFLPPCDAQIKIWLLNQKHWRAIQMIIWSVLTTQTMLYRDVHLLRFPNGSVDVIAGNLDIHIYCNNFILLPEQLSCICSIQPPHGLWNVKSAIISSWFCLRPTLRRVWIRKRRARSMLNSH